jgi:hypothetical protein
VGDRERELTDGHLRLVAALEALLYPHDRLAPRAAVARGVTAPL